MSRYDLSPKAETANKVVKAAIGWDRPLQTFFAQVFTRTEEEPDDGEATIWLGTAPGELATPEAAIAIVAPYAVLKDDLADRLHADMIATIGQRDGPYQTEARRGLFGSLH